MYRRRSTFLSFAFLLSACSTTRVIRDRQYDDAVNAFRSGDPSSAEARMPKGEAGGLITTSEKSWLGIWQGKFDPKPLQKQIETFNARKYVSLSREAEYFLLQEAEEGYVPSEHEVVLLHLLSAIEFFKTGRADEARVELRQAGYVLDRFWDDPALRLWLGSLWAAAGEWEEARVDFRRANEFSPSAPLENLARLETPPAHLNLNFYGVAPVMTWANGEYAPHFAEDPSEPKGEPARASTRAWFERHKRRNSELRDVLVKSNFMAQYLGSKALTETERGINKTAVFSVRATAVAVGAAITGAVIYALSQTNSSSAFQGDGAGYLLGGGLLVGTAIWKGADQMDRNLEASLRRSEAVKNDDLKIYRMIRFLPGWISVNAEPAFETDLPRVELKIPSSPTAVDMIQNF